MRDESSAPARSSSRCPSPAALAIQRELAYSAGVRTRNESPTRQSTTKNRTATVAGVSIEKMSCRMKLLGMFMIICRSWVSRVDIWPLRSLVNQPRGS